MKRKFQPNEAATQHQTIEVKIGPGGSVIVEQSELDKLIEAVSEMKNLAADGRALMNIPSA